MKSVSALIGAIVLTAVLAACGGTNYDASAKPTINDQEALTQVTRVFEDVLEKNKADLEKFLAPNFVQQRTTGVGITKDDYINGLPDL